MYQCKDIADEVNNYIDGELPLGKRVGLFFHLLMCSCCRNYLQQIRSTISVITVSKPKENDATDTKELAKTLHGIYKSHQH
jgi:hypothetical protein